MYFKFQFLVEDMSGAALIDEIMKILLNGKTDIEYDCKFFHGIGGFSWKKNAKETKTGKLLNDLPQYLRGFNRSLQYTPSVLVIVLDNDTKNTELFYQELYALAEDSKITMDYVFCVAVEEMEAWLLGDESAILAAYPKAKLNALHAYQQDSICGTWEVMAEVVYPGGYQKFEKDCSTYAEKGRYKCEWAANIGQYMVLNHNKSPSFQHFLIEITKRIPCSS